MRSPRSPAGHARGRREVAGEEPLGRPRAEPAQRRDARARTSSSGERAERVEVEVAAGEPDHVLGLAAREADRDELGLVAAASRSRVGSSTRRVNGAPVAVVSKAIEPHRDPTSTVFDDLVIGAGMAGLTVAALLARAGRRVLVLEAHDTPGGYAHTFAMGDYRFCAQVHYIFGCGEGEPCTSCSRRLGLEREVPLPPPRSRGLRSRRGRRRALPHPERAREVPRPAASAAFPRPRGPLRRYFDIVDRARPRDSTALPADRLGWREFVTAPLRFPQPPALPALDAAAALRPASAMPPRLQAVLAGQAGDYLLPPARGVAAPPRRAGPRLRPRRVLPARSTSRTSSAASPTRSRRGPAAALLLEHEVERILVEGDRVTGVRTADGRTLHGAALHLQRRPPAHRGADRRRAPARRLARKPCLRVLVGHVHAVPRRPRARSARARLRLVQRLALPSRRHQRIYRRQLDRHDSREPWLFMSTPTLHTDAPGPVPAGHQILEVATSAPLRAASSALRARDRRAYNPRRSELRDRILDDRRGALRPWPARATWRCA